MALLSLSWKSSRHSNSLDELLEYDVIGSLRSLKGGNLNLSTFFFTSHLVGAWTTGIRTPNWVTHYGLNS